jgi:regulator of nucleoside diphosphate kinase
MSTMKSNPMKPNIIVSEADERSLTRLAAHALERTPDLGQELLAEVERACIVPATSVTPGVVQMGSIIEFRQEGSRIRRVQLVYPGLADIAANRISILTPIGTALLGLREGQSIEWKARDGRTCRLTVISVGTGSGDAPAS